MVERSARGGVRKGMRLVSWIVGVFLALCGLAALAGDQSPGSVLMSLGVIAGGLLIIPPIVDRVRGIAPLYQPVWSPPLAAVIVMLGFSIVASPMLAAADAASPEGKARAEKARAAAAEERVAELAEVETLITTGTIESTSSALKKLNAARYREDVAVGGSLRPLYERATAAAENAKARGEANAYIAKLGEMTPRVEAIFTDRTGSELVVMTNLETMDDAARLLHEGAKFADDDEVRPLMNELRRTLVRKQSAALPAMRASWGSIKDEAVWENDMDIVVQGGGNRTIRFIAGLFAANRNIAQFQQTTFTAVSQLRFRRTQYEWYRGSEYTYYTLETPGDAEVGYWAGSTFVPVPDPN